MTVEIELRSGPMPDELPLELVERKGIGHPDTICDMLSEAFSVALSRYYLEKFGAVLHHNVDKALLSAGQSEAAFGGGRILKPIDLYLSGRATAAVGAQKVPIAELAEAAVGQWFRDNMHAVDVAKAVRLHCITQPGSAELVKLFMRQRSGAAMLANDTSIGVGFAPASDLERVVLTVAWALNDPAHTRRFPETGEDIKVMGVREGERISLTISCAFIGRFLSDLEAYRQARENISALAAATARKVTRREVSVQVNTADNPSAGEIFLTVSGTSAEAGDDGETGRGNRMNGLITPYRPMCMEAVAGKNPITHVGKLYTAAASKMAQALVAEVPGVKSAECYLVSQIGRPIDQPRATHVRIHYAEPQLPAEAATAIDHVARREIARIPGLWHEFLAQSIAVA